MRRRIALAAEIVGGLHDSSPEDLLPHAIDSDAGGERMIRGEEPFRKAQPILRHVGGHRRQNRRGRGFYLLALLVVRAAIKDMRERRAIGALLHHVRESATP